MTTVSEIGGTAAAPTSRRERVRASTLSEIKACALDLMRERGSTQVHFADIARAMGMTAPALYRYFDDRDDLLTALIRDAYNDLADTLAKAIAPVDATDDWARLSGGPWCLSDLGTGAAGAVRPHLRAADPRVRC